MSADFLNTIESPEFDCFSCVYELSKHGSNLGLQFVLVQKLERFSYTELEFFIPQMIQILVSFESDSMALHDLIINISKKHPHFCLLAFWNLQAYVYELKSQPESYSFHVVRSFINKLQDIMFNQRHEDNETRIFRENFHPAVVMSAAIAASVAFPQIHQYSKPLIVSQGRQQKSFLFRLANFHQTLTKNLTLKNRGCEELSEPWCSSDKDEEDKPISTEGQARYPESLLVLDSRYSRNFSSGIDSDTDGYNSDYSQDRKLNHSKVLHKKKPFVRSTDTFVPESQRTKLVGESITSHSMPDLLSGNSSKAASRFKSVHFHESTKPSLHQNAQINYTTAENSDDLKTWALKVNYFRKETEFMMVLQNLSSRLSQVPKEARLTSLRAELSIINSALLPSQIDIPRLFPLSSSPQRRYHRILKLNVTEACVLNSAERVPFLLFIEYLSEDMDFDPSSEYNKSVLCNSKMKDDAIFQNYKIISEDISVSDTENICDNEADLGDVSIVALTNQKLHFSNHLRANMTRDTNSSSAPHARCISLSQKNPHDLDSSAKINFNENTRDLSAQIQIAAVMLKQLEKSGQANSEQSVAIKSRIISSMEALQDQFETIDYQQIREISGGQDRASEPDAGERKIENDFKIGEDWAIKRARIRKLSPFGHLPNWDLCSVIVKNGDDLQQEAFACQLITVISNIWRNDKIGAWTKTMKIVVTSFNSGLVETINNALSVHSIKKTMTELSMKNGENPRGMVTSIKDYFKKIYGAESSMKYKRAQECFARSLAAYSIICYVLQIKDRHNGNIMLDNEGHIIHIDFGFILSNSPGSVGFEAAPFKLTSEYIELLGGFQSPHFRMFVDLCKDCFLSLRKHCSHLVNLVDLMQKDSELPCFKNGSQTAVLLKQRLHLDLTEKECDSFVETNLVDKSAGSVYTRLYDQFQLLTQGIFS